MSHGLMDALASKIPSDKMPGPQLVKEGLEHPHISLKGLQVGGKELVAKAKEE